MKTIDIKKFGVKMRNRLGLGKHFVYEGAVGLIDEYIEVCLKALVHASENRGRLSALLDAAAICKNSATPVEAERRIRDIIRQDYPAHRGRDLSSE